MRLFLTLFLCLLCLGAKAPRSTWTMYSYGADLKWQPSPADADIARFSFPAGTWQVNWPRFPAFLTTTTDSGVIGNLTGKTITANVEILKTGNPVYIFGGQVPGWNGGSLPPHTRLFFSTSNKAYHNTTADSNPNGYWWSSLEWVALTNIEGVVELREALQPAQWSNASGQNGMTQQAGFNSAVANVRQIGLAYGGGSFYDIGCIITNNGASSVFHLISFGVQ